MTMRGLLRWAVLTAVVSGAPAMTVTRAELLPATARRRT